MKRATAMPPAAPPAPHPGDQATPVAWSVWYCAQATDERDRRARERFAARILGRGPAARARSRIDEPIPSFDPDRLSDPVVDATERDVERPEPTAASPGSIEMDLADLDRRDEAEAAIEAGLDRGHRRRAAARRPNMSGGTDIV